MGPIRVAIISVLYTFIFLGHSVESYSQVAVVDTSDYLPLFYDGAAEYNLMTAASKGYSSEIERLILKGADVNAESNEGATPLILAISGFRLNAVKTLLKYNADPDKVTPDKLSPLLVAVRVQQSEKARQFYSIGTEIRFPYLDIIETLIRYGADINARDRNGATALNYSSIYGDLDLTDLLLYYGADKEIKSYDGTSPLMAAIWSGYADVADLLIQNGANLESRDNEGFTPFLVAAQNGDTLIMDQLLKNGVDIYEKNIYNWDALTLAIKSDQLIATEFLLKIGNKWGNSERRGINPLSVAAKYRRKEIFELLQKSNFPAKYKASIDQMALSMTSRFNPMDVYAGLGFAFKEPLRNIGFIAGFDTKLWYSKVLVKSSENLYYQFMDKSSAVYAGIFKDFPVTDNIFKSNIYFSTSLSAGYSFGNKYKGSNNAPESRFRLNPAISLKWTKNNFSFVSGLEYMNTDFSGMWPLWCRLGFSYNFFFDTGRGPGKIIKWY
jgi:ankyrin repeat protein